MITLEIPVEKIPYIRTIEGRKFNNGKWSFPSSSIDKLKKFGLISDDFKVEVKEIVRYELSPHLRKYQKEIANKALNDGCYGIFMDTGTGKTMTGLEISKHLGKTLILCPLSIIESAWIEDCNKYYPQLKIMNCWAETRKKRVESLKQEADIYIMNYESFKILKNEIIDEKFQCLIVDESSVMKNMKSQITQEILSMVNIIPHRFVLSGCPTPNHNSEIFPQMKLVDSDILGNNYYGFLAKYFSQDMENPHRWYQTEENKQSYFNRLRNKSIFLSKDDCVDLPEKTFEVRKFSLLKEQQKYYDNIVQDIQDNINTWSKFEFTAKLMKLREIVSGFVIDKQKNIIDFETSKDKLLQESIDEIGDKPIIVWCQFTHEVEILSKKFNGVALTSKTKNRNDIIKQFKNSQIKLLFTNPQLLGKGLTFTNCNYNIYYSLSFSYEEFKQSQDRIHRIGQKSKCTYIVLQGKNTIDERIYKCLQKKENAVDELYLFMGLQGKQL